MDLNEQPQLPTSSSHKGRWALIILLIIVGIAGAFRIGYVSGKSGYTFEPKSFKVINREDAPKDVDYSLLWSALDIVNEKYIDRGSINPEKVLYGAIQGAVSAAGDEYTEFFDPATLTEFRTQLQGSFSGIGAEVGERNNAVVIIAPLEGSPAEAAGVLPQDIIVSVDGDSTQGKSVDEVVSKIRGPEGTKVTLTLFREGRNAPFDITITRQKIEIKSIKVVYREVNGKKVAILTISRFGEDTKPLFDQAVSEIRSQNVSGIVLDVRNNPGGYLDTSIELASDWLEQGKLVVKEERSQQEAVDFNSYGYNRLGGIKTVTLINGGSASASEILAGALKDNGKTVLIGEKSFGKGSVQELVSLGQDMAVKVTIAKWITPSGKHLNKDGLNPDIEVGLTEEDIQADRDPQLDRALEEVVK